MFVSIRQCVFDVFLCSFKQFLFFFSLLSFRFAHFRIDTYLLLHCLCLTLFSSFDVYNFFFSVLLHSLIPDISRNEIECICVAVIRRFFFVLLYVTLLYYFFSSLLIVVFVVCALWLKFSFQIRFQL